MRVGMYERDRRTERNKGRKRWCSPEYPSSQVPSSQQARDIRPPWGDSELTSAPMRLPDHQVLRTPAATPGEPTRDGVWQACSCPWPHSAYETIFYLDSGPGIPAVGKRVGWGCHGDPQAWIPRDAPCILPSLPLLIAGGERDSPLNISRPSQMAAQPQQPDVETGSIWGCMGLGG